MSKYAELEKRLADLAATTDQEEDSQEGEADGRTATVETIEERQEEEDHNVWREKKAL